LIIINIISIFLAGGRWFTEPMWHQNILATCVWCSLNVWLGLMSIGAFWERKQIRNFHRIICSGKVDVTLLTGQKTVPAEVFDLSASGIGFKTLFSNPPLVGDHVDLRVQDSYGNHYQFSANLVRVEQHGNIYFCGAQFIPEQIASPQVISFVYGDSQRWQDIWDRSAQVRDSKKQLLHLTILGFSAFIESSPLYFRWLYTSIKNFFINLINPLNWLSLISVTISWVIYSIYLIGAKVLEAIDHEGMRKFSRIHSSQEVNLYFPRLHAHVKGQQLDISLTGIGISANLPFTTFEGELLQVSAKGVDGHSHLFDCVIKRMIHRNGAQVLGAEFIVDSSNYPDVVRFVYGQGSKMIISLTIGNLRNILSYLFLVSGSQSVDKAKSKHSHEI